MSEPNNVMKRVINNRNDFHCQPIFKTLISDKILKGTNSESHIELDSQDLKQTKIVLPIFH